MNLNKKILVQNCIIFLLQRGHGKNPDDLEPGLITAAPAFISIGTISDADGPTTITLTDDKNWPCKNPDMKLMHEGTIETPARSIQVCTVLWEEVFSVPVKGEITSIQILANDSYVPDRICIILD